MIPLPSEPKIIEEKDNRAVFEMEGLYPGYGVTIGNSLRRVLLSSLSGSAITEVKIKGVNHEFSTIPGVLEDVILILLNLKKLRFHNFSQESQSITLSVKGEREVKGKDFKINPQLKIANPQAHIATLTKSSAELVIEAKIEKGFGYEPAEKREKAKKEIGVISLDTIFTPIKKVSFSIENMRVGKRTDFDRLRVEVETDGTLSPKEAFSKAAGILVDHFSLIFKSFGELKEEEKSKERKKEKKKEKETKEDPKKMKVEDLKISERTRNALLKNNVNTVGGVLKKKEENLKNLEGLGDKALGELKKSLKKMGLELK